MKFFEFVIKQKLIVNLLAVFVVILGFYMFVTTPKETFPPVKMGLVIAWTMFPNAAPGEVEKLITTPYEDAMKGLKGIDEISSSSSEGFSMIIAILEPNFKNTDKLITDIQRQLDRVQNIPEEADDPQVFEITTENIPVLSASFSGGKDYEQLRETAKLFMERTDKIDGVAQIEKWGYLDRTIWVNANTIKLDAYGLTIFDLVNSIRSKNMSSSSGNVTLDNFETAIRVVAELKNGEDVKKVIIRSNEAGRNLKIGEASNVIDGFKDEEMIMRSNGSRSIMMTAYKNKDSDTIKVTEQVKMLVKQMQKDGTIPKEVNVSYSYDMAKMLKDRLNMVYENGVFGAVLVLAILLLLLRPSIAIFTALGLPVAFGISLLVMKVMGVGYNMMSLFGYIMVLGMLVDNNIVIGENVYRYIEQGKKIRDAVLIGSAEVVVPVMASVLTTVSSFAPLLLITGIMGEMVRPVPIVITLALAASLIESYLILPSHLNDFVRPKENEKMARKQEHWYEAVRKRYSALLQKVLYHRGKFIIAIVLLFFVSIPLGFMHGFSMGESQVDQIVVNLKMPTTNSLKETEETTIKVEQMVMKLDPKDVESVQTYMGYQDSMNGPPVMATNLSQINVLLNLKNKRKTKNTDKLLARIRELTGKPEGVTDIRVESLQTGAPTQRDIDIAVTGDSYEEIQAVSNEVLEMVKSVKNVKEASTDLEQGKKEIKLVIDDSRVSRAGISNETITGVLRASIAGMEAVSIKRNGEDIKIMVRLDKATIKSYDDILRIRVPNMYGQKVLLKELVKTEPGYGFTILKHRDGRKSISVIGSVDKKPNVGAVNMQIMNKLKEFEKKYPKITFLTGGEYKQMEEGFGNLFLLFIVAILFIYIVIAALFNSLTQPLLIMLAIPFGFIGVMLTLFIHWMPVSFAAFMGFIGLSGVVVNNSILMTDFFNRLVKSGENAENAIIHAASIRLRPIILTTATTMIGVLPMGYSIFGASDPMIKPVALVFAWGLLFGTIITLFLIPAFHVFLHNLKVRFNRKFFNKTDEKMLFVREKTAKTQPVKVKIALNSLRKMPSK